MEFMEFIVLVASSLFGATIGIFIASALGIRPRFENWLISVLCGIIVAGLLFFDK